MSDNASIGLKDAYSVKTPDDNVRLYRDWANTYDSEFAGPRGYVYPLRLAELFAHNLNDDDVPVLDVGAGTGLVAEALRELACWSNIGTQVDAIDISPEMLEVSNGKKLYRRLLQADLTQSLQLPDDHYGALVSAGTFTHGHVGPDALLELLRIARPGALFCLGINGEAFDRYGFGSAFAALSSDGRIDELRFRRVSYYENAEDEHGADQGFTAIFRKTGVGE